MLEQLPENQRKLVLYLSLNLGIIALFLLLSVAVDLWKANEKKLPELSSLSYKEGQFNNIFKHNKRFLRAHYDLGISLKNDSDSYYLDQYVLRNIYDTTRVFPSLRDATDGINSEIKKQKTDNIKIWYFDNNKNVKEVGQLAIGNAVIYRDWETDRKSVV